MSGFLFQLRNGRLGQFPLWLVIVFFVLVAYALIWWRRRKIAKDSNSSVEGTPTGQEAYASDYSLSSGGDYGGLVGGSVGSYGTVGAGVSTYNMTPTTNNQWSRLGFDWVIGQATDPALAERALAKYIDGQSLTADERSVVNAVQTRYGSPPEGLILSAESSTTPPPTTEDPPPSNNGGGTTPPPPTVPSSLTVPANVNLYDWAQSIEKQYGLTYSVFDKVKSQLSIKWGLSPDPQWNATYGNMPYITSQSSVRLS